jgi:thiol:disulfide interchange protein DsbA
MTAALTMNRRRFTARLGGAAAALPLLSLGAAAQAATEPFTTLKQAMPIDAPAGKVDVAEFFTYACPHCNALEPTLEPWVQALPANVVFHRVPAPFLFNHENFQRLYYTLEAMGAVNALQAKVFHAVHVEHQRLDQADEIAAFAARNGLDRTRFMALFNSFAVQAKARRATQLYGDYGVNEVPTLVVQGRYLTSPGQAGGAAEALRVVGTLIERVRQHG